MRGEGVLYVVDGGGCENVRIITIKSESTQSLYSVDALTFQPT
jgi:hypothetical protein